MGTKPKICNICFEPYRGLAMDCACTNYGLVEPRREDPVKSWPALRLLVFYWLIWPAICARIWLRQNPVALLALLLALGLGFLAGRLL